MKETININVPVLARVEGEGALDLTISNQQITELKLRIYEPPRYFEKFLEGRNYYDVPDTVARICGICPVAYQMSASHAIESVFKIKSTPWIRSMRRLFYCGEWLQSHSLHIHLLAAPDYLGFNSAIEMAEEYNDEVLRGLKLQALGNDLVALFGARSVHPVGVKIGGFSKAPDQKSVNQLQQRISAAKEDAINLVNWLDTLELPDDQQDFISVALHHDSEYPFNEGRLVSDHGLNIDISEFEQHFKEQHVDHSTALHCLLDNQPYLVGPLARINLNKDQLPEEVQQLMAGLRVQFPSKNMFHSIIARALEIYFCILEADELLKNYTETDQSCMDITPQAGTGFGCTEAPRGILWHRYDMDEKGCVKKAVIVPPTSQNQSRIEEDLKNALIQLGLDHEKQVLQLHAEKVIRNYDPCISCATHFLDLKLKRDGVIEENKVNQTRPDFDTTDLTKTAIIAIGSPTENDNTAFKVTEQLRKDKTIQTLMSNGLQLLDLDRPGIKLNDILPGYQSVILIDAINPDNKISDSKDGYIWLKPDELDKQTTLYSTHQIKIPETFHLMKKIQTLPENFLLIGVVNDKQNTIDQIQQTIESFFR